MSNMTEKLSVLKDAYSHLTSRDPKKFWTSGQWMTERKGGSDVGKSRLSAWIIFLKLFCVNWEFNSSFPVLLIFPLIMILTLCTCTSVFIFSSLFSLHFLWCWQGEFDWQSGACEISDHFLYSNDLNVWLKGDAVISN